MLFLCIEAADLCDVVGLRPLRLLVFGEFMLKAEPFGSFGRLYFIGQLLLAFEVIDFLLLYFGFGVDGEYQFL